MSNYKFKIGDIVVINTNCAGDCCKDIMGCIIKINLDNMFPYRTKFDGSKECSVDRDNEYCVYCMEEIRKATKDEEDKYYLMKYKD